MLSVDFLPGVLSIKEQARTSKLQDHKTSSFYQELKETASGSTQNEQALLQLKAIVLQA